MKTYAHVLEHLAEFFLKRMFQVKVIDKETHILCSITFSRKSCIL